MFFYGLGFGIAAYLFILFLFYKRVSPGICLFIAIAIGVVVFAAMNAVSGLGYVTAIVILFVIGLILGSRKEKRESQSVYRPTPRYSRYVNHCWNCGTDINSEKDVLCPKCGKHYICSYCGKCYCDNPLNKIETKPVTSNTPRVISSSTSSLTNKTNTNDIDKKSIVNEPKKENAEDLLFKLNYSVDYLYDYIFKLKDRYYISSISDFEEAVKILTQLKETTRLILAKQDISLSDYISFYQNLDAIILNTTNRTEQTIKLTISELREHELELIFKRIKESSKDYIIWLH